MPASSQTLQLGFICSRCSYWFPKPVRTHKSGSLIVRLYGSTSAPIWRPTRPDIPAFFSSNISIRGADTPNYANLAQPEFLSLSIVKYPPPSIPLTAYKPIAPLTLSTRFKIIPAYYPSCPNRHVRGRAFAVTCIHPRSSLHSTWDHPLLCQREHVESNQRSGL